ncbi:hypothetical protein C8T65DRAFT_656280 [Cerioporus squamosus]|nr:hypothetical protein C8T65DRAFT_656280 [Cerioporus squamosus]
MQSNVCLTTQFIHSSVNLLPHKFVTPQATPIRYSSQERCAQGIEARLSRGTPVQEPGRYAAADSCIPGKYIIRTLRYASCYLAYHPSVLAEEIPHWGTFVVETSCNPVRSPSTSTNSQSASSTETVSSASGTALLARLSTRVQIPERFTTPVLYAADRSDNTCNEGIDCGERSDSRDLGHAKMHTGATARPIIYRLRSIIRGRSCRASS